LAKFAQQLKEEQWGGPLIILVGIGETAARISVSPSDLRAVSDGRP
jgi:hypothetical protein